MKNEVISLNKNKMKELIDKNLMVIATLFFSGAFIAGKFSIAEFPVYSLTFFRFLIAAVVLFLIMWKKGEDLTLEKADIPRILLLSLLGMVGYHVFFFTALKYTSSVNTSLIAATNPIMTTIMASLFLKEKFPKKAVGGILISFLGVAMIVTNGSIDVIKNMNFNIGDIYMLLAVLSFSLYFIVLKGIVGRVAPIKLTSYVFLFCVILLIPMVIYENPMSFLPSTTWTGWSSLIYMSIFASVIAYLIQQVSVKRIGPAKTSLYVNLVPLFSMIMAYFILGEIITLPKVLAGFMIISGVIITLKSKK
ncbi:DMT family transporter [Psychrilyobacter atlanticus]|uniref:DMT family transporter n=1 Tax=Psychrilyobacter atlanticus TaxID=271091 RepID=UPI0003FC5C1D|nr:DMT family transporter [Psychrilyobacter atlanticus]